jgi:hypothetical protein
MGLFDGRQYAQKFYLEKKKAPVSGKKSKTDQVQITTSDDDFTEPIWSTTN